MGTKGQFFPAGEYWLIIKQMLQNYCLQSPCKDGSKNYEWIKSKGGKFKEGQDICKFKSIFSQIICYKRKNVDYTGKKAHSMLTKWSELTSPVRFF